VATDQKSGMVDTELESSGSPIENELPAYRAISRAAVFSVLFGVMAVFSFAHPFFYVFAVLSLALGIWANVTIKRFPDMLTGRGLANAGIALGLVFGLTSATITSVQSFVRTRDAEKFARKFAEILKEPTHANALWYSFNPVLRKTKTPTEALQEYEGAKGKERIAVDQKMQGLMKLRGRLKNSKEQDLHFVDIERVGEDDTRGGDLYLFALSLYEVHGPATKQFPEKEQYALAILKGKPKGRQYDWWVDELYFPYIPRSYLAPDKPADDGHGHAH
jgi:hypothetical protein